MSLPIRRLGPFSGHLSLDQTDNQFFLSEFSSSARHEKPTLCPSITAGRGIGLGQVEAVRSWSCGGYGDQRRVRNSAPIDEAAASSVSILLA